MDDFVCAPPRALRLRAGNLTFPAAEQQKRAGAKVARSNRCSCDSLRRRGGVGTPRLRRYSYRVDSRPRDARGPSAPIPPPAWARSWGAAGAPGGTARPPPLPALRPLDGPLFPGSNMIETSNNDRDTESV